MTILGLRPSSSKIPSWHDHPDVVAANDARERLQADLHRAERDRRDRLERAHGAVKNAEDARAAALAREYAGVPVDRAALDRRVEDAERALKQATGESVARDNGLRLFDDEVYPERCQAAIQEQAVAMAERYKRLVPQLRAAILKAQELNALVAELDAITRADFDNWNVAVRLAAYEALPGQMHFPGPITERTVEGWLANLRDSGF